MIFVEDDSHWVGSIDWNARSSLMNEDANILGVNDLYSRDTGIYDQIKVLAFAYNDWFELRIDF